MAEQTLIVDGHIHYYDCYQVDQFFDSALAQMERLGKQTVPAGSSFTKILLFTEGKDNNFFARFKANPAIKTKNDYSFEALEEESIKLMQLGQTVAYILRGRQIVTRENLEVLTLASNLDIPDGLPIRQVIEQIIENENIAVLAWGTGKWLFKRGRIIRSLLEEYRSPFLLVGDNSARPGFWPSPIPFRMAKKSGTPLISGSDPLPFPQEYKKAGSYCFVLNGDFAPGTPAQSIRKLLSCRPLVPKLLGHRDNTVEFFQRQIKMFLKKHTAASKV